MAGLAACKTLGSFLITSTIGELICGQFLTLDYFDILMDIESHETDGLLKKRAPKRQGLAFKLAILLCGLGLLVGVASGMGRLPAPS